MNMDLLRRAAQKSRANPVNDPTWLDIIAERETSLRKNKENTLARRKPKPNLWADTHLALLLLSQEV